MEPPKTRRKPTPGKPTREQFQQNVKAAHPHATFIMADRALYVMVRTADDAMAIEMLARAASLDPRGIDRQDVTTYIVRIFGFSRRARG